MLCKLRVASIVMISWLIVAATVSAQPFTLRHTFNDPTPTSGGAVNGGDHFGYAIALDGNRPLLAAPYDDTIRTDAGQVHLFNVTTGNLLQAFDDPHWSHNHSNPAWGDRFGLAINALNGNHVAIGETYSNQVYLFDATTGNLLRTFYDPNPNGDTGFPTHRSAIAMNGNHILIEDSL